MASLKTLLLDSLDLVLSILKIWIDLNTSHLSFNNLPDCALYIKLSIALYNGILLLFLIVFLLNLIKDLFINNLNYLKKLFAVINSIAIVVSAALFILKLYVALKIENILGPLFYPVKLMFYKENSNLGMLEHFATFSTAFSDAVILLSIIVGMICLDVLGLKNLLKTFSNLTFFFLFNFFVIIMVSTHNLLIMFLSFEFIFLPTVYFAYTLGYSKKIDKATQILFIWTLFGSFLVLCCLAYVYYKYNTLNYLQLSQKTFTKNETTWLLSLILIGFGIKIPLAPFHFWLLKVHVESPTAFSIFLSGFLVKSAFYCLFMLLNFFKSSDVYLVLMVWILYSLLVGTLGLARQIDIKKLIAWATIQEMSFILLFLVFKQQLLTHACVIFLVLHGLMSSYMFFLIDVIQRRFKTRSVQAIKGLNLIYPDITKYIWFLVFLFSGFPFTVKFFIEWSLISLMLNTKYEIMLITLFIVNFLGVIFFCKAMFSVLYGTPESMDTPHEFLPLQLKEKAILNFLAALMLFLLLLVFIIKWKNKKTSLLIHFDG